MKQIDWASDNTSTRGGKRDGAGRKPTGKQTVVVRLDAELLPLIEQLKQGVLNPVTDNQDVEIERLKQRNLELVEQRDAKQVENNRLSSLVGLLNEKPAYLKSEIEQLNLKLTALKKKERACQCLTAKGSQCQKKAVHEVKARGFLVWVCERHYNTVINKQ